MKARVSLVLSAAFLAGCAQSPIGAPGAMPQSRTIAQRAARGDLTAFRGTTSGDLIYAVTAKGIDIITYPEGAPFGRITSQWGQAVCSDPRTGDVYTASPSLVYVYAHGATTPSRTLNLPSNFAGPTDCSVDTKGNVAIVNFGSSTRAGYIAIYFGGQGTASVYSDPAMYNPMSCAFDGAGNLFVDGFEHAGSGFGFAELPNGSGTFTNISVTPEPKGPGPVQWDGSYITVQDSDTIMRLRVSGSSATVIGTTQLSGAFIISAKAQWIQGTTVIAPYRVRKKPGRYIGKYLAYWKYTAGGTAYKVLRKVSTGDGFRNLAFSAGG